MGCSLSPCSPRFTYQTGHLQASCRLRGEEFSPAWSVWILSVCMLMLAAAALVVLLVLLLSPLTPPSSLLTRKHVQAGRTNTADTWRSFRLCVYACVYKTIISWQRPCLPDNHPPTHPFSCSLAFPASQPSLRLHLHGAIGSRRRCVVARQV